MCRQLSVSGFDSASPVTVHELLFASKLSLALEFGISSTLVRKEARAVTGEDSPRDGSLKPIVKSACWIPTAPVSATVMEAVVSEFPPATGKFIELPLGKLTAGLVEVTVPVTLVSGLALSLWRVI